MSQFFQQARPTSIIVFDIETIPDIELAGALCDLSDEKVKSMTNEEKRQEMVNYHIDNHNGNAFLRQPFHKIACISFLEAKIDFDVNGYEEYIFQKLESFSTFKSSEKEVVEKFWKLLKEKEPRIISFNGSIFDINVLKCKALKYGIDCGWYFQLGGKWDGYEARYGSQYSCDLMNENFGNYTLHEICIMLGIPCKLGVDGSKVAEYFDEGRIQEIREYCETDVLATYLVYLRIALTKGMITKEEYNNDIKKIEENLILWSKEKKGLKEFLEVWYKLNNNNLLLK